MRQELKMIPSYFKKYEFSSYKNTPAQFKLGTGHILFFTYRPQYTLERYNQVFEECIRRGYNVNYEGWRWSIYNRKVKKTILIFSQMVVHSNDSRFLNFKEDKECTKILIERIIQKVQSSPKKYFHYYHQPISKEEVIKKLLENY